MDHIARNIFVVWQPGTDGNSFSLMTSEPVLDETSNLFLGDTGRTGGINIDVDDARELFPVLPTEEATYVGYEVNHLEASADVGSAT